MHLLLRLHGLLELHHTLSQLRALGLVLGLLFLVLDVRGGRGGRGRVVPSAHAPHLHLEIRYLFALHGQVGPQLASLAFGLRSTLRTGRRRHLGRLEGALGRIDFGLELLQRILGGDPSELRNRRL